MFIKPAFLILLFPLIIAVIYSCTSTDSKSADIIFRNAYIFTVDSSNSKAEALAIKGGKFVFVGDNDAVKKFIGKKTKVIDLKGKMILPGFIDAHCHPISSYRYFYELNLYGLKTAEEFQIALKKYITDHPDAKYIKGRGWSNTDFPKTGPDKKIIDEKRVL